eukprot:2552735-Prymnesium_polylepis.1
MVYVLSPLLIALFIILVFSGAPRHRTAPTVQSSHGVCSRSGGCDRTSAQPHHALPPSLAPARAGIMHSYTKKEMEDARAEASDKTKQIAVMRFKGGAARARV